MMILDFARRSLAAPALARGRPRAALALVCAALLSGCGTFTDYNEVTENALGDFEKGNFDGALRVYREDLDATNDGLLYHFEAATAAHYGKNYAESQRIFDAAYEKIMQYVDNAKVTAGSVAQTAASFLVNEKTISYDGKTFEHILVQGYQARNRFMAGQRDQCNNEVTRTKELQDEARLIFRQELEAAQDAQEEKQSESVDVAGVTAKMQETYDYTDLSRPEEVYDITWIRYLIGFLHEAVNTGGAAKENARAEYAEIEKLRPTDKLIKRDISRFDRETAEECKKLGIAPVPPRAGSVALFLESGMGPKLDEVKVVFPTLHGAAAVALPKYTAINNPAVGAVLIVGDERCETSMLSSVRQIAYRFHKDRLPILIAKQIVRLAAKIALQEGGHAAIASGGSDEAQLGAAIYSVGMSIWNVASEQADLRCWRTLPDSLHVARVYLPEGDYPAKVQLVGPGGGVLREVDLGMISIKAERHRMIDARSLGTSLYAVIAKEDYDGKVAPGQAAPEGPVTRDLTRADTTQPQKPAGGGETSSTTDVRRPDASKPDDRRESSTTTNQAKPDANKPDNRRESSTTTNQGKPDAAKPDNRRESSTTANPGKPDAAKPDNRNNGNNGNNGNNASSQGKPENRGTATPATPDKPKDDPLAPPRGEAIGHSKTSVSLDALAPCFTAKHPLCIELRRDNAETLYLNCTVEECRDEKDAKGRHLVVMTNNYDHEGTLHYFSFVIREGGEIESVDLMSAQGEAWQPVQRDDFWFKPIPGASCEVDQDGDATLMRRGVLNRERGSKSRVPTTLYLRTYQVENGRDLDY